MCSSEIGALKKCVENHVEKMKDNFKVHVGICDRYD